MKPREFSPRATLISALVVGGLIAWSYISPRMEFVDPAFRGEVMGTSWSVKLADTTLSYRMREKLGKRIQSRLDAINAEMSTWLPDSPISRFNAHDKAEAIERVENEFAYVLKAAIDLSEATGGAFDPTVDPLVRLWGFGEDGPKALPSDAAVAATRAICGISNLIFKASSVQLDGADTIVFSLQKKVPELTLNLNAIAKGHAVDRVHRMLVDDFENVFVEIGGEVRCSGLAGPDRKWRLGISRPLPEAAPTWLDEDTPIVELTGGMALATSGNYRNFIRGENGQLLSHIIDPRTGRPAVSPLLSVSVLAGTCMEADGIATALFVMGLDEGLAWVEERANAEALFLYQDEDGGIGRRMSSGFGAWLKAD